MKCKECGGEMDEGSRAFLKEYQMCGICFNKKYPIEKTLGAVKILPSDEIVNLSRACDIVMKERGIW